MSEFAVAFPDACEWLNVLPLEAHRSSLKDFFDDIMYDGRPEFVTCWACLLLTNACRKRPTWFDDHASAIKALRTCYRKTHRIDIVPARCITKVASGSVRSI